MMRLTVLLGALSLVSIAPPVLAQTGTIVGTVTSAETGQPLPDVQIRVQGTTTGAMTRDDGRYSLSVPVGTYIVRALRIGYAPDSATSVVVRDGQTTTADITMRSAAAILKSVVSIGYGTQQTRDRTGVVDQVTNDEFNTGRVLTPTELIQAKVAGIEIMDNAEPGGATQIRIRGGTSVNASNEPLIVIDGIPLTIGGGVTSSVNRNPLDFVNPNDIESITVLKDASATAIYGSRGANGVLMITTKTGVGSARVTYSGSVSGSKVTGNPDLLTAAQFKAAVNSYYPANNGIIGTSNTDWRGAVQRNAGGQEHSLAIAGAGTDNNYRLSLGMLDQGGVVIGTALKRVSASLNYSDKLFENKLAVRTLLSGSRTDDWYTPGGVIGEATAMAPTQPIRTTSGSYFEWTNPLAVNNPIAELNLVTDRGTTFRSIGKLEGEYKLPFLEALSVTSRVGYDVAKSDRTEFYPSILRSQVEQSLGGQISRTSPSQMNTLFDLFGTYRQDLTNFSSNFDVTGGYSFEESKSDYPSFYAQNLSSDLLGAFGIPGAVIQRTFLTVDESRLISFFGRVNYSLRDKYLATLSVRKDGSSKFGPDAQWGTFPSAAFAWRVIDEPFMKRFKPISELKGRISWGINGNQAIPNYGQFAAYTIGGNTAQYQFGNQYISTIRPGPYDPGIKWEETRSQNLGLDYGLFNGRFSGAFDYYYKLTKDLLFDVPIAAGTNFSNHVLTNIGSVENEGIEFSLNALVLSGARKGFTWNATFNASTNRNELMSINKFAKGAEQINVGGIAGGVGSRILLLQPGYPINSFFVYKHKRNPDGSPVYADVNGDLTINEQDLYVDINQDGKIDQADRRPYKNPAPKAIFGHTSTFTFRDFDAGFTIRAYRGNYVYNNVASNLGHYSNLGGNAPVNLHSSVLRTKFVNPQYFSDVYVEDASFIRMDNLSFGYTFRQLRSVSQVRLFGVVQNVFTSTDYSGVDPMAGINGIDNNLYPRSRTMTAGVNVAF